MAETLEKVLKFIESLGWQNDGFWLVSIWSYIFSWKEKSWKTCLLPL
jgi:hypothetical protein